MASPFKGCEVSGEGRKPVSPRPYGDAAVPQYSCASTPPTRPRSPTGRTLSADHAGREPLLRPAIMTTAAGQEREPHGHRACKQAPANDSG
ncbi:hypothetical protein HPB50_026592 [Hyalomma asiaticum]|uniref:Uncharacterized protein n=1 Tax=Hyalomma asiaticum TaxID=266040 RepID=A0ACB7T046_HYAAI|nr:hypothetical protein HPB50_026592 [Hyalomma asiaticum]